MPKLSCPCLTGRPPSGAPGPYRCLGSAPVERDISEGGLSPTRFRCAETGLEWLVEGRNQERGIGMMNLAARWNRSLRLGYCRAVWQAGREEMAEDAQWREMLLARAEFFAGTQSAWHLSHEFQGLCVANRLTRWLRPTPHPGRARTAGVGRHAFLATGAAVAPECRDSRWVRLSGWSCAIRRGLRHRPNLSVAGSLRSGRSPAWLGRTPAARRRRGKRDPVAASAGSCVLGRGKRKRGLAGEIRRLLARRKNPP